MKKTIGSETTYYFYALGGLVSEFTTMDRGATAAAPTDRTTYQTSDKLGTAVLIMEASGLIVDSNRTFPYGEEWQPALGTDNEAKFTSYQRDGESGLDYAMNRYYASVRAAFLSVDQGRPHSLRRPGSLNRYTYALNDPLNLIDPDGNTPYWVWEWERSVNRMRGNVDVWEAQFDMGFFDVITPDCNFMPNEVVEGSLVGGQDAFWSLTLDQQLVFQNITMEAVRQGIDWTGIDIRPANIEADRITFDLANGDRLQRQIENLDAFAESSGFERGVIKFLAFIGIGGHAGANDFLARQRGGLQFGNGPSSGFLDIDRFVPTTDVLSFFGHQFANRVDQRQFLTHNGKPPPLAVRLEEVRPSRRAVLVDGLHQRTTTCELKETVIGE